MWRLVPTSAVRRLLGLTTTASINAVPKSPKGQLEKLNSDTHPDSDMLKGDSAERGIYPVAVEEI
jgi:hypothetical protein